MNWQADDSGFLTAEVDSRYPRHASMTEFCSKIKTYVLPNSEEVSWDYLRVEFWPDSGRIIAFPAASWADERIEKSGCQIILHELLGKYNELAESDISDDEFSKRLVAEEQTWINAIVSAARETELTGLKIVFWEADDEAPLREEFV